MTELMQIQPFIQAYVLAVSSILEAEVTVVDSELIRVGGTGSYLEQTGQKISHDSFFKRVLQTGKPGIIRDVKEEFTCHGCESRDTCKELANLAYPIFLEGNAVGIIAIIAFKESEREQLLQNYNKLEEFLKYMSVLIESKITTSRANIRLTQQIDEVISSQAVRSGGFIGKSSGVLKVLGLVEKVAGSQSSILIQGESGTGKEVLAKVIHASSQRHNRLMISINCAAIPENLVESELFGYEEGAFTGAKKSGNMGKFELANHSTLFLDEIGDIPLAVQTKLLRVLQENMVERLGGKKPIPIDVRIICATNKNLEELVAQGLFREDLYYRINVIPIHLPPLRERREDIPLLVDAFIKHYNSVLKKNIQGIEADALTFLTNYDWPGNVRELKNIIEYLENMAEGPYITRFDLSDLPRYSVYSLGKSSAEKSLDEMLTEYERTLLEKLVRDAQTTEQKELIAQRLQISRATLYRKLSKYGL